MQTYPSGTTHAAVDWLTATGMEDARWPAQAVFARGLLEREGRMGNPRDAWAHYGYLGWQCGRAAYATRRDGLIVVARSGLADEVWKDALDLGFKPSRLDVAVTVWTGVDNGNLARRGYQHAVGYKPASGRPGAATIIIDSAGGQTLYLGRRQSQQFGRLYDKHAQSDDTAYRGAWRYEVECKQASSASLAGALSGADDWRALASDYVHNFFANRGVSPVFRDSKLLLPGNTPREPTGDSRKLAWLADQVGPGLSGLIDRQGLGSVLIALGLADRIPSPNPDSWRQTRDNEARLEHSLWPGKAGNHMESPVMSPTRRQDSTLSKGADNG